MTLCIDIGNTRTKAGLFSGKELRQVWVCDNGKQDSLFSDMASHKISRCIISSTIDLNLDWLQQLRAIPEIVLLDEHTNLPFQNRYGTPKTLGKDRLALAAAAVALYPGKNVLVIGCGTCITLNFKNDREAFLGGSIHPGLKMRLRAMHAFTGKLPLVDLNRPEGWLADNTEAALLAGAVYGAAREIDGMIEEYAINYEDLTVLITGGDADMLVSMLKNQIFAFPDLTLAGLNKILESNA